MPGMSIDNGLYYTNCHINSQYIEVRGSSLAVNTPGAWVVVSSGTPANVNGIGIYGMWTLTGSLRYLFDIGIGIDSEFSPIVSNVLLNTGGSINGKYNQFVIPLRIPQSMSVAMRLQRSDTTQGRMQPSVSLIHGGLSLIHGGFSTAITYGADIVNTRGTLIDPGATIDQWGAWTTVATRTAQPIRSLLVSMSTRGNAALSSHNYNMQLGIGEAGAEVPIVNGMVGFGSSVDDLIRPCLFQYFVQVPTGVRISARAAASINDAEDRVKEITITGFN